MQHPTVVNLSDCLEVAYESQGIKPVLRHRALAAQMYAIPLGPDSRRRRQYYGLWTGRLGFTCPGVTQASANLRDLTFELGADPTR